MRCDWFRSSIGRKILMAASGLLLWGFVILHLGGNLLIYAGPDAINAYAWKLRELWPLLWAARATLLAAAVVHIVTSIHLTIENRAARPQRYQRVRVQETSSAARTMALSGLLVTAFIVYHLLHVTFRVTHPALSHATDALGRHDVYSMMVRSFQDPVLSVVYLLGVAFVCLHLSHGFSSALQTLGLTGERALGVWVASGRIASLVLFAGYASIPLAVSLGLLAV